jgi:K+-transporting ATPase ATPase C chain
LISDVSNRTIYWQNVTGLHEIPVDLATGSASGLDPDISLDAAMIQVPRIARARGLDNVTVENLVNANIEGPLVGSPGDQIVNVVKLNLALDYLK